MSEPQKADSGGRLLLNTVIRYILWFLTSALFIICALVARNTLMLFTAAYDASRRWLSIVGQLGMIVFGLTSVILIFIIEGRYRKAAQTGSKHFYRSFAIVTAWQIGFLFLTWLAILLVL